MMGMEGKMWAWGKEEVLYHSAFSNLKTRLHLMDSVEWIWPFSAHECAHGHECARWWACACVTCCFWFKGTHLVGLMPDHQSFFFISSVGLPFVSPHSFLTSVSPISWVFSLSGAPSACGPLRESWGAAQYSNVASFMCSLFIDPELPNEWD